MASTWGTSWGTSWGASWDISSPPTPPTDACSMWPRGMWPEGMWPDTCPVTSDDQVSGWASEWKHATRSKKQRKRDEDLERIRLGILPPELRIEADAAVKEAAQASVEYTAGRVEKSNALAVAVQARDEYEEIYRKAYKEAYDATVVEELWREDVRRARNKRAAILLLLN